MSHVVVACAILLGAGLLVGTGWLRLRRLGRMVDTLLDAAEANPWPEHDADRRLLEGLSGQVRARSVRIEAEPAPRALNAPVASDRWVVVRRGLLPPHRTDRRLVEALAAMARASHDSSEREARLIHDAVTDPLTGLWDYAHWFNIFGAEAAERTVGTHVGVVFLDLNRFKQLNSEHGHLRADDVLAALGDRLRIVPGWTFGRFGGDEFVGFIRTVRSEEHLNELCRDLARRIDQPVTTEGRRISVSATIGRVLSVTKYDDPERLIERAESDMRQRKSSDRAAGGTRASDHELVRGLLSGGIDVAFQPLVHLESGQTRGWEALLRSSLPYLGSVGPSDLVHSAARVGALDHVTRAVADRALSAVEDVVRRTGRPFHVSVNLELQQLRWDSELLDWLIERSRGLEAHLMLEVTERALGPQTWTREHDAVSGELAGHGIGLVLDDYGAGQSRTDALLQRRWDWVKLDSILLTGGRRAEVMLGSMVDMLHELGTPVVLEGVETEDHAALARKLGVDLVQGHLFGHAAPAQLLLDGL